MGLPEDDRRALLTRLAPAGASAADLLADAVAEDEELREIVVDAQGDVVAFTDRRALFVARRSAEPVAVDYDRVELRKREAGLAIDVLLEGGRLVLDVARGTFARLGVVGTGAPPARATWLPARTPPPRPTPPPPAMPAATPTAPPLPPGAVGPAAEPIPAPEPSASQPPPPTVPLSPPPGLPPAGWHPDPGGRHWWRWWDGLDWTEHVADGGSPFVDPLPPRA